MESDVVAVEENALDSIRWNTGNAKGLPVSRSHHHDGHYRHTWPKSFRRTADGRQDIRPQRRSRPGGRLTENFYFDLVIRHDLAQNCLNIVDGVLGQDAAIDRGGCKLGQCVHRMPTLQQPGHTGGTEWGVPGGGKPRKPMLRFPRNLYNFWEELLHGTRVYLCPFLGV